MPEVSHCNHRYDLLRKNESVQVQVVALPSLVRLRCRPESVPGALGLVTRLRLKQRARVTCGDRPGRRCGLIGSSAPSRSGRIRAPHRDSYAVRIK